MFCFSLRLKSDHLLHIIVAEWIKFVFLKPMFSYQLLIPN